MHIDINIIYTELRHSPKLRQQVMERCLIVRQRTEDKRVIDFCNLLLDYIYTIRYTNFV